MRFHDSIEEFRTIAEPLYRRDPVLHTIELTLLNTELPADRLLLTVHDDGSAVTAAAAALARREGVAEVVLFADLANPVSNAIYQRIGFVAAADSIRIDFVAVD